MPHFLKFYINSVFSEKSAAVLKCSKIYGKIYRNYFETDPKGNFAMTLREKIEKLLSEIAELESSHSPDRKLPQNTYYLNDSDIVCMDRRVGESRYPYDADGLVVWARSSGYIEACESTFSIFKTVNFSEDPSVGFFAGIPTENGYIPLSVTGASKQLFEPCDVKRYLVYAPRCAYYITDTESVTFTVRLHVDFQKHIHFTYTAINKTDTPQKFYMESDIEAILRFAEVESFWDRMSKFGKRYSDGSYLLRSENQCLVINSTSCGGVITDEYHTVGKSDLTGGVGRTLANALALKEGKFTKQCHAANTTDIPVAADMIHYELAGGEMIRRDYDLSYYHSIPEAEAAVGTAIDTEAVDAALIADEIREKSKLESMQVSFGDWNGKLRADVLNRFLRNVQKQVSFCALGKNYAGPHIGIRDVMQQLESSLIWQPEESRAKIITALNYILEDGRPPRQFSLPATEDMIPDMDLRMYIDQGVWIISTVYTYLSYTDDYSILDEECSYYVASEDNSYITKKSDIRDTVLDHLIKIMDFLARNLDTEGGTNCLRALYGDWNDAIDGLGRTTDPGKSFGTGVTVMATLQYWQNLREMSEILTKLGKYTEKLVLYKKYSDGIEEGLKKYAIDVNENGERRVIHGWGDKMSYKLGSWHDPDGVSRLSTTSHSFWVLSGMIAKDPSMKEVVMKAFNSVVSNYGLKTFDKAFPMSIRDKAGRISTITAGTYENAAAYVHASMFAIMALFSIGESRRAWEEMEKSVVISHDNCTKTSFVMPNSYCETSEYDIDGDSMGDWYTGSGTVLIKETVKFGFGVCPDLDGLWLQMPEHMPCTEAALNIKVKGHPICVTYSNEGKGKRSFTVDGKAVSGEYCELMNVEKIYIPADKLHDGMNITVND